MADEVTQSAYEKLKGRQRAFVDAYLSNGFNATQAAITAKYAKDSAHVSASRLLRNDKVAAAIEEQMEALAMGKAEILARLTAMGRGDIAIVVDDYGNVDLNQAVRNGQSFLIKKAKFRENIYTGDDGKERVTRETEVEMYDAQAALVHLGKGHGLFKEQVEHSGEIQVTDVRERLAHLITRHADRSGAGGDTE